MTTAANGTYTLSGLSAGEHQVEFGKTGYAKPDPGSETLAGGQTLTVDVALSTPGSVGGVVWENAPGNPAIAGATVTYPGGSATTDANGACTIAGLRPVPSRCQAAIDRLHQQTANPRSSRNTTVTQELPARSVGHLCRGRGSATR